MTELESSDQDGNDTIVSFNTWTNKIISWQSSITLVTFTGADEDQLPFQPTACLFQRYFRCFSASPATCCVLRCDGLSVTSVSSTYLCTQVWLTVSDICIINLPHYRVLYDRCNVEERRNLEHRDNSPCTSCMTQSLRQTNTQTDFQQLKSMADKHTETLSS